MKLTCKYIVVLAVALLGCAGVYAQKNTYEIKVNEPTCPNPSNASIEFSVVNEEFASGVFEFIVSSVSEKGKVVFKETVAIDPLQKEYSFTAENLPYQYEDPVTGVIVNEIDYHAYISNGSKTLKLEVVNFQKPEYSATLTPERGAGCHDEKVGKGSVAFTLGVPPYEWDWHKIGDASYPLHENEEQVTDMNSGKYFVTVTDFKGCKINSDTVEIKPVDVKITAALVKPIICKDEQTGVASASIENAYKDFCTVTWIGVSSETVACDENENASAQNEHLPAGDVFVAVEDELGCQDTTQVFISQPEIKMTLNIAQTNILCKDDLTGAIDCTTENANGEVIFAWSDDETADAASRSELPAGAYTVVATDEKGCKDTKTVELTQPSTKVAVSVLDSQEPSCFGYADANISATAEGGDVGGYSFFWNDTPGDANNMNIPAGDYTIVVKDSNGCTDTTTHHLDEPKSMEPKVFIDGVEQGEKTLQCNGESADVEIKTNGLYAPKTYDWGDGDFGTVTKKTGVLPGDYSVTVKANNGCEETVPVKIVEPEKLNISIVEATPIRCNGDKGVLRADVGGGAGTYTYSWSNGAKAKTSGEVSAGEYTVEVTDEYGCSTTATYTLSQPAKLEAKIILAPETCAKSTEGNLSVTTSGGQEPYSYNWQKKPSKGAGVWVSAGTTETVGSLTASTIYALTVKDANGCQAKDEVDLSKVESFRLYPYMISPVSCPVSIDNPATASNTNNGELLLKVVDGQMPYNVTIALENTSKQKEFENIVYGMDSGKHWNTGEAFTGDLATQSLAQVRVDSIPEGVYEMHVVDYRGCEKTTTLSVGHTTEMSISVLSTTESACTEPTGTAQVVVSGGKALTKKGKKYYLYEWDNGDETAAATELLAGDHLLKVTDAKGCVKRDTITIEPKTALRVKALANDTKIHCIGGTTGKASAYAYYEGDETPHSYTFSWSAGDFDPATGIVTNLPKGTHTVTVTDNDGCAKRDKITFTEEDLLQIVESSVKDVACHGENSGQIVLQSVVGGDSPYEYAWSDGGTTSIQNTLPAGDYSVIVSDASGCKITADFSVTEPDALVAAVSVITLDPCASEAGKTAELTIQGGTPDYSIKWDGENSLETIKENLTVGIHNVSVSDANGCSSSQSFEIKEKQEVVHVSSYTLKQPTCGDANGTIFVVATASASGNYFYTWYKNGMEMMGESTTTITDLGVGLYRLSLSDGVCTFDTTFALSADKGEPAEGVLTYIESTCEGDSYSISITDDASAEYSSYEWKDAENAILSTSKIVTGLHTGLYSVWAIDKNDCPFVGLYSITEKQLQVVANSSDVICYGAQDGTLDATANEAFSGAITYTWYDDTDKEIGSGKALSSVDTGTYYVKAYDANHSACPISSVPVKVNQPERMIAVTSVETPSYCKLKNGTISVSVVNGESPYSYEWKSASDNIVLKTDAATNETKSTLERVWFGEDFVVTITDAKGCEETATIQVTDVSDFIVEGILREPVHCVGDATAIAQAITVNGYEPFTYVWEHDATLTDMTAENLPAGEYKVTVTDAKGCAVHFTFNIEDAKPLIIEFIETPEIICHGSIGDLFARVKDGKNTPYSFQWYSVANELISEAQELEDVKTGTYKVKATDKYGCESELSSYNLKEPEQLRAEFSVQITECGEKANTGKVVLDTVYGGIKENGYRFRWITEKEENGRWYEYSTGAHRTMVDLPAGKYICIVTDANDPESCFFADTLYTNPILPISISTDLTASHCNFYDEEDAKTSADGAIEITKIFESQGNYMDVHQANIVDYTYKWNDALAQTTSKATKLPAGEYEVTVTGSNGCSNTFDAGKIESLVSLNGMIVSTDDATPNRKTVCLGDSVNLAAVTNETFAEGYTPTTTAKSYVWTAIERNSLATIHSPNADTTFVRPNTKYYRDSALVSMSYFYDGCYSRPAYFTINHYDSLAFSLEVYDSLDVYVGEESLTVVKDMSYLISPKEEPWFVNKDTDDGVMSIAWYSFKPNMLEKGAMRDTVTNESTYNKSGNYGIFIPCTESNYYVAVATTRHGCRQRASIFVEVRLMDIIPTGFSPNGDGINDTWVIPKLQDCPNANVTVFNRWGLKVFENKVNYFDNPWNGTAPNGNPLPMGTYYYVIEFNDEHNTPTATGPVSIIR